MVNTNTIQKNTNILEVGDVDNTLKKSIYTYLEYIKVQKSVDTYKNYLSWFKDFFQQVFKKEMEFVTWNDISDKRLLNINAVRDYSLYLKTERENRGSSINNKISAIRTLFEKLNDEDVFPINTKAFNVDRLSEDDSETYDALSYEEVNMLYDYCKNYETNGYVKYLYFKTLYITAFRFNAVRNIKWNDIKQKKDDDTGTLVWTISVVDKGKRALIKPISNEFYTELLQLKTIDSKPNDSVFSIVGTTPMSKKTIQNTFDNYCKKCDIDKKNRYIVIHSVKGSSASRAYEISGHDIKATQIQANHKHSSTTIDKYVNKKVSLTNQISYIIDKDIDKTALNDLSREQYQSLINEISDSFYLELERLAKLKGYIK